MTRAVAAAVLFGILFCGRTDAAGGGVEPPSADVLFILDLSSSLTLAQRLRSPVVAATILEMLPKKAAFAVYILESSMSDSAPVLSDRVPNPVTTTQTIEARRLIGGWKDKLQKTVDEMLDAKNREKQKALTSCYVKSAAFASNYFRTRPPSLKRTLVWIGDLIEDCREPDFRAFRLTGPRAGGATLSPGLVKSLPSLKGVEVVAAILPRQATEARREVEPDAVIAYWRDLASHFGMPADQFRIGTPEALGLVDNPLAR